MKHHIRDDCKTYSVSETKQKVSVVTIFPDKPKYATVNSAT